MSTSEHVRANQRLWDTELAAVFARFARRRWEAYDPFWGLWCTPQAWLLLLPDQSVAGQVAVELGCGFPLLHADAEKVPLRDG